MLVPVPGRRGVFLVPVPGAVVTASAICAETVRIDVPQLHPVAAGSRRTRHPLRVVLTQLGERRQESISHPRGRHSDIDRLWALGAHVERKLHPVTDEVRDDHRARLGGGERLREARVLVGAVGVTVIHLDAGYLTHDGERTRHQELRPRRYPDRERRLRPHHIVLPQQEDVPEYIIYHYM